MSCFPQWLLNSLVSESFTRCRIYMKRCPGESARLLCHRRESLMQILKWCGLLFRGSKDHVNIRILQTMVCGSSPCGGP